MNITKLDLPHLKIDLTEELRTFVQDAIKALDGIPEQHLEMTFYIGGTKCSWDAGWWLQETYGEINRYAFQRYAQLFSVRPKAYVGNWIDEKLSFMKPKPKQRREVMAWLFDISWPNSIDLCRFRGQYLLQHGAVPMMTPKLPNQVREHYLSTK